MIGARSCHDCGVQPGQLHDPGCDTEVCPRCGEQAIACGWCYSAWARDDANRLPWTGNFWSYRRCPVNGPAWWNPEARAWIPGRWMFHTDGLVTIGTALLLLAMLWGASRLTPWGSW